MSRRDITNLCPVFHHAMYTVITTNTAHITLYFFDVTICACSAPHEVEMDKENYLKKKRLTLSLKKKDCFAIVSKEKVETMAVAQIPKNT